MKLEQKMKNVVVLKKMSKNSELAKNFMKKLYKLTNQQALIIWTEKKIRLIINKIYLEKIIVQIIKKLKEMNENNFELLYNWFLKTLQKNIFNWNNTLISSRMRAFLIKTNQLVSLQIALINTLTDKDFQNRLQALSQQLSDSTILYLEIDYPKDVTSKIAIVIPRIEIFDNQLNVFWPNNIMEDFFGQENLMYFNNQMSSQTNELKIKNHDLNFTEINSFDVKWNKKDKISSDLQSINYWISKITLVIDESSCVNNIYYQLFNFQKSSLDFNQFKRKILSKLTKIIKFKYPELPYELVIKENSEIIFLKNNGYLIKLKIYLYDKAFTKKLHVEQIDFLWINNLVPFSSDLDTDFDFTEVAIKKLLKINKSFFYDKTNKTFHLVNLILAILTDISLDFTIGKMPKNILQDLKTTNCYFKINYQDKWVFDVTFNDNETIINKKQGTKLQTITQNHLNDQKPFMTSCENVIQKWKKISKTLSDNFINLWSKNDYLYEIQKITKHLFKIEYEQSFSDTINITLPNSLHKKLSELFYYKISENIVSKGLKFSWIFNSYNYKFEIENFQFQIIEIENSNRKLMNLLWKKINQMVIDENSSILKTHVDLLKRIYHLSLEIDYIFTFKLKTQSTINDSFKKTPFIIDILIDNKLINTIKLDWNNREWLLMKNN